MYCKLSLWCIQTVMYVVKARRRKNCDNKIRRIHSVRAPKARRHLALVIRSQALHQKLFMNSWTWTAEQLFINSWIAVQPSAYRHTGFCRTHFFILSFSASLMLSSKITICERKAPVTITATGTATVTVKVTVTVTESCIWMSKVNQRPRQVDAHIEAPSEDTCMHV